MVVCINRPMSGSCRVHDPLPLPDHTADSMHTSHTCYVRRYCTPEKQQGVKPAGPPRTPGLGKRIDTGLLRAAVCAATRFAR